MNGENNIDDNPNKLSLETKIVSFNRDIEIYQDQLKNNDTSGDFKVFNRRITLINAIILRRIFLDFVLIPKSTEQTQNDKMEVSNCHNLAYPIQSMFHNDEQVGNEMMSMIDNEVKKIKLDIKHYEHELKSEISPSKKVTIIKVISHRKDLLDALFIPPNKGKTTTITDDEIQMKRSTNSETTIAVSSFQIDVTISQCNFEIDFLKTEINKYSSQLSTTSDISLWKVVVNAIAVRKAYLQYVIFPLRKELIEKEQSAEVKIRPIKQLSESEKEVVRLRFEIEVYGIQHIAPESTQDTRLDMMNAVDLNRVLIHYRICPLLSEGNSFKKTLTKDSTATLRDISDFELDIEVFRSELLVDKELLSIERKTALKKAIKLRQECIHSFLHPYLQDRLTKEQNGLTFWLSSVLSSGLSHVFSSHVTNKNNRNTELQSDMQLLSENIGS